MNKNTEQKGFIVGSLLVLIVIISVLLVTITSSAIGNFQLAKKENARVNAQFAADSGLDQAIFEVNQDETWPGTGFTWNGTDWIGVITEQTLLDSGDLRTTYEVSVTDLPSGKKSLRSTGRAYSPSTETSPTAIRIFEVELENLIASNTSIVTGVGGLVMNNSSKIVDGSVYANGTITMDNTAQIGTSTNPLSVFVVNKVCPIPADATYPTECASGENDDPISINSPNSFIYGKVYANYQSDDTNMIDVDDPATTAIEQSSGVPEQPLPVHDRNALIAGLPYSNPTDSSVGTPANVASCTTNGGSRVWGGTSGEGEKIRGDVVVSKRCNVEIRGPVWITGSLEMRNQGEITVADSLGSTTPDIMIDGEGGLEMNQSATFTQNSSGTNVQVVTYWSEASCSPDCLDTEVTGVDLANSQDTPTIDIVNAGDAAEAIFYAKWSKVIIRNSVNVGALVGQVVELEQSATIAFSSSLPGFVPRSVWIKEGYLRVYR